MKNIKKTFIVSLFLAAFLTSSCEFGDLNNDKDNLLSSPIDQQLTSLTVNVGFMAGSDLNRFSLLIMQQYSGLGLQRLQNQTQIYQTYNITASDQNNLWSTIYATILNDAENVIEGARKNNSPHYSGVAKILKAYTYQVAVDTWGSIPFSETQKLAANVKPKYDSDEAIYTGIVKLLDEGIAEVSATTSFSSPGMNSTIFPGTFSTVRTNWIKFANTLKYRIYLHYSEKDPAFAKRNIDALIAANAPVMASNAESFQMSFVNVAGGRNPIDQFHTARVSQLAANSRIVNMMNATSDPRRVSYFTASPSAGIYTGSPSGLPGTFSRVNTYLRGSLSGTTYSGDAPIRMLTFAEYNFIRAEAALRFNSAGNAETFFQAGIRASMQDAGVAAADITTYIAANGSLTGTPAQQLEKIINEKYIANFGVVMEPWTDWRRTGFPALVLPPDAVINFVPRSLFYPQSEIDVNPENVKQKAGMNVRVFWDTRP